MSAAEVSRLRAIPAVVRTPREVPPAAAGDRDGSPRDPLGRMFDRILGSRADAAGTRLLIGRGPAGRPDSRAVYGEPVVRMTVRLLRPGRDRAEGADR